MILDSERARAAPELLRTSSCLGYPAAFPAHRRDGRTVPAEPRRMRHQRRITAMRCERLLFGALALALVTTPASAKPRLGLVAGFNVANLDIDGRSGLGARTTFAFGGAVDVPISERFGVRVDPMFLSKGGKATKQNAYWGVFQRRVRPRLHRSSGNGPVRSRDDGDARVSARRLRSRVRGLARGRAVGQRAHREGRLRRRVQLDRREPGPRRRDRNPCGDRAGDVRWPGRARPHGHQPGAERSRSRAHRWTFPPPRPTRSTSASSPPTSFPDR